MQHANRSETREDNGHNQEQTVTSRASAPRAAHTPSSSAAAHHPPGGPSHLPQLWFHSIPPPPPPPPTLCCGAAFFSEVSVARLLSALFSAANANLLGFVVEPSLRAGVVFSEVVAANRKLDPLRIELLDD